MNNEFTSIHQIQSTINTIPSRQPTALSAQTVLSFLRYELARYIKTNSFYQMTLGITQTVNISGLNESLALSKASLFIAYGSLIALEKVDNLAQTLRRYRQQYHHARIKNPIVLYAYPLKIERIANPNQLDKIYQRALNILEQ